MTALWKAIPQFDQYSVSDKGQVRSNKSERLLTRTWNNSGIVRVGMMRNGVQYQRSVPLLVARAFIAQTNENFDTPINLDGDKWNNFVWNLMWRPRWFAVKYTCQFRYPYLNPIYDEIRDVDTGEISFDSLSCAKQYGLLESDIVLSIYNKHPVWPTNQRFEVV